LIDHALAAGRAAGFKQASISFLIGNEAAERDVMRKRVLHSLKKNAIRHSRR